VINIHLCLSVSWPDHTNAPWNIARFDGRQSKGKSQVASSPEPNGVQVVYQFSQESTLCKPDQDHQLSITSGYPEVQYHKNWSHHRCSAPPCAQLQMEVCSICNREICSGPRSQTPSFNKQSFTVHQILGRQTSLCELIYSCIECLLHRISSINHFMGADPIVGHAVVCRRTQLHIASTWMSTDQTKPLTLPSQYTTEFIHLNMSSGRSENECYESAEKVAEQISKNDTIIMYELAYPDLRFRMANDSYEFAGFGPQLIGSVSHTERRVRI
jgi:hypothetical protein